MKVGAAPYVTFVIFTIATAALGLRHLNESLQAQSIVYGTPVTQPTRTSATITRFTIQVTPPRIEVEVADQGNVSLQFSYPANSVAALDTDAEVAALIASLNTTNFSGARSGFNTGSLRYRIVDFLCRDFAAKMPSGSCTIQ